MPTIFENIKELDQVALLSKHEQIVNGIINSIDRKLLVQGSTLPSVKVMANELGFAPRTIAKAYNDLKGKGLVESRNRLGYYIVNEDTFQVSKVALLMYAFHPFQEIFYNTFREKLGENIQVDVFFHHSNIDICETILKNIKGQYGMYVVAPIPHPKTKKLLKEFSPNELLLVDRFEKVDSSYSHVTQEFRLTTYQALIQLKKSMERFDEVLLFFRKDADYPIEILQAYQDFIKDFDINGSIKKNYVEGELKKGTVYFTIGDSDLWKILKDCKEQNIEVGKDVGVFSNCNDLAKEIVFGGITTFSTDFKLMAEKAAQFVIDRTPINEIISTKLIRRKSL